MQNKTPKAETNAPRKPYVAPKLTAHGDVRSLTQVPVQGGNCSQLHAA